MNNVAQKNEKSIVGAIKINEKGKKSSITIVDSDNEDLEKRKDRPSFKPEVAKVLENFAGSYQK